MIAAVVGAPHFLMVPYEWRRMTGAPKQPYLIRRRDGDPLGFAGLWETWVDQTTGEEITSCTIITCTPNELMAELHDRMPVILDPADYDAWLDPQHPAAGGLLRPCPSAWLEALPVSTRVNSQGTTTRRSSSLLASRLRRRQRCSEQLYQARRMAAEAFAAHLENLRKNRRLIPASDAPAPRPVTEQVCVTLQLA